MRKEGGYKDHLHWMKVGGVRGASRASSGDRATDRSCLLIASFVCNFEVSELGLHIVVLLCDPPVVLR